jgi:hypothetical protein
MVPAAAAAQSRADVETDHVDAFDDVGPRSFGILANARIAGLDRTGARVGVELDLGLSSAVALSLGGECVAPGAGAAGCGAALGAIVFFERVPFHGLYVQPRLTWSRVTYPGSPMQDAAVAEGVQSLSAGAVVGWELTWRAGPTVRFGGGLAYSGAFGAASATELDRARVQSVVDAAAGWVF